MKALYRTIIWTLVNLTLQITLALGISLLLNTEGLRGRGIYKTLMMLPWGAMLASLPTLLIFFGIQRYLVSGLTAGGVKY